MIVVKKILYTAMITFLLDIYEIQGQVNETSTSVMSEKSTPVSETTEPIPQKETYGATSTIELTTTPVPLQTPAQPIPTTVARPTTKEPITPKITVNQTIQLTTIPTSSSSSTSVASTIQSTTIPASSSSSTSVASTIQPTTIPASSPSSTSVTTTVEPTIALSESATTIKEDSTLASTATSKDISPTVTPTRATSDDITTLPTTTEIAIDRIPDESKRPLYVIGHMTNSIDEVIHMVDKGANGVEFDVNFDPSGTPTHVFHGYLCDLGRVCDRHEEIDVFLDALANMTSPGDTEYRPNLVLLYFDLKLHNLDARYMKYAGEKLANKVVERLRWQIHVKEEYRSKVNVVFVVEYPSYHPVFIGAAKEFRRLLGDEFYYQRIGWSFDGDGFSETTASALWKAVELDSNIWRGYGAPNMFSFLVGDFLLDDAVCNREQSNVPAKVLRWTVDNPMEIRHLLRKSIDAILTNFPVVPSGIAKEGEFKDKYRMATIDDSPWTKFKDPNYVSKLCKRRTPPSFFNIFGRL